MFAKRFSLFALLLVCCFAACKKDKIAPFRQDSAFVKYFGHVKDQMGMDIKRTADGGYILVGSTNSFRVENFYDIYLVKTDSLGNEQWSKKLGAAGWEDRGHSITVLANGEGYLVAGTRQDQTPIPSPGGGFTLPSTKIVLYKLDPAGELLAQQTLRTNRPNASDEIGDIKQLADGGFILTGRTTGVDTLKPEYTTNRNSDLYDLLTIRLTTDLTPVWERIYGFVGKDRGVSVQTLGDDFIITGVTEIKEGTQFYPRFFLVKYRGQTGTLLNQMSYGESSMHIETTGACKMADTNRLLVFGHVTQGLTAGALIFMQVDVTGNLLAQSGPFTYFRNTIGGVGPLTTLQGGSILKIPSEDAYMVSCTNVGPASTNNSDIIIFKMAMSGSDGLVVRWAGAFGSRFQSFDRAGSCIAVEEAIPGTEQKRISGYAFTGTFDLGTNKMMGIVKINEKGNVRPSEFENR